MFRLIHRKTRVILHRLFQGTKQYFRSIATMKSIMCLTYLATISTNSRHIPTATLKTSNNFDFTIIRRNALLLVVRGIPTEYSAPIISPRRHHSSLFFCKIRPPYQNSVTYQYSEHLPYSGEKKKLMNLLSSLLTRNKICLDVTKKVFSGSHA